MEPGLSSPATFRHRRGAAVRPTDAIKNEDAERCGQGGAVQAVNKKNPGPVEGMTGPGTALGGKSSAPVGGEGALAQSLDGGSVLRESQVQAAVRGAWVRKAATMRLIATAKSCAAARITSARSARACRTACSIWARDTAAKFVGVFIFLSSTGIGSSHALTA